MSAAAVEEGADDDDEEEEDEVELVDTSFYPRRVDAYWDTDEEEDYVGSDADGGVYDDDEDTTRYRADNDALSVRDLQAPVAPSALPIQAAHSAEPLIPTSQAVRQRPAPRPFLPTTGNHPVRERDMSL